MKRTPRVLYIVTIPLSAAMLMRGQLGYLREAGFHVAVACSQGPEIDVIRSREQVNVHVIPMEREISPLKDVFALWKLWTLIRRINPDVVNVGTPKAGLLGGLAALAAGVPCRVYTLRGLRLETATGFKRWILVLCERIAAACAHEVLCVSESLRQQALMLGLLGRRRTHVLGKGSSNGINPSRAELSSEQARLVSQMRKDLGLRDGVPVIGFVGRLTKDKGIVELVNAFITVCKEIPEAQLLLVGPYEKGDPVPEDVRHLIDSHPNILSVGYVPDPMVFYHLMTIYAFPTYREGFPTVVLEAGLVGLPVVGFRATGVVDAVIDGHTGLLGPIGDAEALASNLLSLIKDEDRAREMGEAARVHVVHHFRSEVIWSELEQFYWMLLREKGVV
ncbi:MAG: glycosyltransferase family 4 protein [Eubacteriales bacterium]|nr:glycosyltransferase family 4 protein [Eubacteriales bacterium]